MRLYFYSLVFFVGLLFGVQNNISEKTVTAGEGNDISSGRSFRTGDYGLVCQNESGSYNTDMENYIYSPTIDIPAGDEVSIDFLLRGSFPDADEFPNVDFWGMQITRDQGQTWNYVSNPYGDTI